MSKKDDRVLSGRRVGHVYFYKIQCVMCPEEFESKRRDAMYHDQACRKAGSRLRRKVSKLFDKMVSDILYIEQSHISYPEVVNGFTLHKMKRVFNSAANALAHMQGVEQIDSVWFKVLGSDGQHQLVTVEDEQS